MERNICEIKRSIYDIHDISRIFWNNYYNYNGTSTYTDSDYEEMLKLIKRMEDVLEYLKDNIL